MTERNEQKKDVLDESLRRLGGILASPSLAVSYGHTTPLLERAWLRRIGLTKAEAEAFLEKLCLRGLMDEGARATVAEVCAARRIPPAEAARLLLGDEGWPEREEERSDDNE